MALYKDLYTSAVLLNPEHQVKRNLTFDVTICASFGNLFHKPQVQYPIFVTHALSQCMAQSYIMDILLQYVSV